MTMTGNFAGKLLIAMPHRQDAEFERAVVLLCAHWGEGAMGVVINRVNPTPMAKMIRQLQLNWRRKNSMPLLRGGPVATDRGFIVYEQPLEIPGYLQIFPDLFVGSNPDILRHLAQGEEYGRFFLTMGHVGWGAGQLETEVRENSWLIGEVDRAILFEVPLAQRWATAIRQLGIDPGRLAIAGSGVN